MYLRLILRGEMVLSVPNMEVLLQPIHFFCCFWLYCLLSELCGRGKSHLDESNSDAMHEVESHQSNAGASWWAHPHPTRWGVLTNLFEAPPLLYKIKKK
jgi:hypothetical protein